MSDLRSLTTDAKRLYDALEELAEKNRNKKIDDIDFDEIWFGANARAFYNHMIAKLETDVARKYCTFLAGLISLSDNRETKITQIRFLARIIAVFEKKNCLQEIINEGLLLENKQFTELREIIADEEIQIGFIIDLLLLVYINGNVEEEQLDYVTGIVSLFGFDKDKIIAIGNMAKGILEQNDSLVLSQNKYISVLSAYCYMKNPPDGILVNDLKSAAIVRSEKIIFLGLEWKGTPIIDLDQYNADTIEFSNCTFSSLQGICSKSKKVVIRDCVFKDCEVKENFMLLRDSVIEGCVFENISSYDTQIGFLFAFKDTAVLATTFKNISIQHNSGTPYGGFIKSKDTEFINMKVEALITKSNTWNSVRRVTDFYGGRLAECTFNNCILAYNSFLMTFDENTVKTQINVEELHSKRDKENRDRYKNYRDLTFAQMFGEE